MRRYKKVLIILILLSPFFYVSSKITILNPAWVIGTKYPNSKIQVHSINSPDLHFWHSVASLFGIPMRSPDHSLTVTISNHSSPLELDDFIEADELYVKNSKISDISAYWKPSARISGAVFLDCDFTALPEGQSKLLSPNSNMIPNSYSIPYETKKMQNKSQ